MHSRDEAIMSVLHMLEEDIIDQFHIKEVTAALEGNSLFSVCNKLGEQITLRNNLHSDARTFQYEIVSLQLFLKSSTYYCHHPSIKKDLHKNKYICLECGMVANMAYFNKKKER